MHGDGVGLELIVIFLRESLPWLRRQFFAWTERGRRRLMKYADDPTDGLLMYAGSRRLKWGFLKALSAKSPTLRLSLFVKYQLLLIYASTEKDLRSVAFVIGSLGQPKSRTLDVAVDFTNTCELLDPLSAICLLHTKKARRYSVAKYAY